MESGEHFLLPFSFFRFGVINCCKPLAISSESTRKRNLKPTIERVCPALSALAIRPNMRGSIQSHAFIHRLLEPTSLPDHLSI